MKPRPHQRRALRSIARGLKYFDRGQVLMACGAGKTMVSMWAAEQSGQKRILVLAPSLALIRQLLGEFRTHSSWKRWTALAVCSDSNITNDGVVITPEEVGCPVTTKAQTVKEFLEATNSVRVVFCTYHSSRLLRGLGFDLAVYDEAHRTSGPKVKTFGFSLVDKHVRIKKRLFFTATPRVLHRESIHWRTVHSMNDRTIYGPVLFKLSFRKAVDLGIICDYKIIISEVTEKVDTTPREAMQVALEKAMKTYKANRVISFHRTVYGARTFVSDGAGFKPSTQRLHVNGRMSSAARNVVLNDLAGARKAVVSNARCLTEGVDIPAVDMVAFVEPKRSVVDIVQAAGRAMRRTGTKKVGYIFIPLFRRVGHETVEAATRSFGPILEAIQAMATQDSVLAASLRNVRIARATGREPSFKLPANIELLIGDGAQPTGERAAYLQTLKRVVEVAVVDGFSTYDPDAKKAALLELAKKGAPRPTRASPLATALSYDTAFTNRLKKIAPHWFHRANENKIALLELASTSAPRPAYATALGKALSSYLPCDSHFTRRVRSLAPHWFIARKEELLSMARAGAPKPRLRGGSDEERRMAVRLASYMKLDATFAREVESANSTWAAWTADRTSKPNKQMLLSLYVAGAEKPSAHVGGSRRLGRALYNYTSEKSAAYDPAFAASVPRWVGKGTLQEQS